MSQDFEQATRVEGKNGVYSAFVSPAWEIWGPNGGYMASIAMRAAACEAQVRSPASFYCQFLRVARFDAIEARVTVVQSGRRSESIRVSLVQEGKPVAEGLLRTALPGEGLEHTAYRTPEVPAPESLPRFDDLRRPDMRKFTFWDNVEGRVIHPERFDPDRGPLPPRWLEWYRFRPIARFDDPFLDACRSLVLIDTLGWPAARLAHTAPRFRAPNLDVVAFFHAPIGHSEWLLCDEEAPIGRGGLIASTARIFDCDGALVASGGAQLLCVPPPPGWATG
jgi:acyl-CoA thioesterase II